jgi:2-iminobutanoate/2-iminopropanoate deaminase
MKYITTPDAPAAVGPYSQGVITGNLLYTAGQIALTPAGKLANETIEAETHQIMANLQAILAAAGCDFSNVVQTRVYITSKELFPLVNEVYAQYFPVDSQPARECVVASPPVAGAHVEISMIAERPIAAR